MSLSARILSSSSHYIVPFSLLSCASFFPLGFAIMYCKSLLFQFFYLASLSHVLLLFLLTVCKLHLHAGILETQNQIGVPLAALERIATFESNVLVSASSPCFPAWVLRMPATWRWEHHGRFDATRDVVDSGGRLSARAPISAALSLVLLHHPRHAMDPYNKPQGPSPHYSLYQRELFQAGGFPGVPTDPHALQASAKERLTAGGYSYAASNAGVGWTDAANREAFYRWRIVPRMLVDTNARDLSVELFGHRVPAPVCFAPIGINKNYARACARALAWRAVLSVAVAQLRESSSRREWPGSSGSRIVSRRRGRSRSRTWPRRTGTVLGSSSSM